MIKTEVGRNLLNLMKNIYKTSILYILLTDERFRVKKQGDKKKKKQGDTVTIAIQHDTGSSNQHNKARKGNKRC